jgi:glycosyltransferase involved in cell wall biosynthesis
MLVAAGTRSAAESFVGDQGIEPALVVERADLTTGPHKLRRAIEGGKIDGAIVHSSDWRRQPNPQLYDLALALAPLRERVIVDEARGTVRRLGRAASTARAIRAVADTIHGGALLSADALKLSGASARRVGAPLPLGSAGAESVLAIWPGSAESIGGSITHITGILNAFRRAGLRVGLLTSIPPPEPVLAVIDDLEVMAALPPAARLTGDSIQIASNLPLTKAGAELARRLEPSFIYQRHSPFLVAGAELSRLREVPLVLEWNASEVWVRDNWQTTLPVERILDRLLVATERAVVADATIVAAVSRVAADMALDAGASQAQTLVLPNAVDVEYVDRSVNGGSPPDARRGPVLGWAGSFGPWHGAEVVVRALARLPTDVRLLMIGDGDERGSCESLAASLGVADRVEWTGAIPRPDALRRLSACDVLVSPHVPLPGHAFFGSPTKIFEYMALARPIVASRLGQLGDVLEDGVTARLVTPGDVDELSGVILEVLESEDCRAQLGRAARHEAELHHTWDRRARTVLDQLHMTAEIRG